MTNGKQYSIWAAFMVASLGAAFAAAGASQAGSQQAQCEIATKTSGGMTVIEGVAHVPTSMTGSYSMQVTGPGTKISQGGDFEASAGKPAFLNSVMLSGKGQRVNLEVTAGGQTSSCSQRI